MKRFFDLFFALFLILFLSWLFFIIILLIKLNSKGPAIYWSSRVGINNKLFSMPKFRSMKNNSPTVATHLLLNPESYLTSVGKILRKSSLDELPQLYSILKGDMSFVGPRPALYSQDDLINLRKNMGIDAIMPGLTGLAQVNGRDALSINDKVIFDAEYMERQSFWLDLKILSVTFLKVFTSVSINH